MRTACWITIHTQSALTEGRRTATNSTTYAAATNTHLQVGGALDGLLDGTLLSKQLVTQSLLIVVLGLQALLLHLWFRQQSGTHTRLAYGVGHEGVRMYTSMHPTAADRQPHESS